MKNATSTNTTKKVADAVVVCACGRTVSEKFALEFELHLLEAQRELAASRNAAMEEAARDCVIRVRDLLDKQKQQEWDGKLDLLWREGIVNDLLHYARALKGNAAPTERTPK